MHKSEWTIIGFRLPPEQAKALRMKVVEKETTIQEIMEKAARKFLNN